MEANNLTKPLVSICMPAYNSEKYVLEAVNSVLKQTYSRIELIVVNDGSTDNTEKILNNISDSRLKVITSVNKGQSSAANLAFNNSDGELVKFMDSDDLISKEFIQLQVECLYGTVDTISSASWGRFHSDNLDNFELNVDVIRKDSKPIEWLVSSMDNKQAMMQCALWLIPRNVLGRAGLWNEKLNLINDFEFIIRVLLSSQEVKFTDNAILYYRSGMENSLSKLKTRKGAESAFNSISFGTNHMLNHENSNRVKNIAADCFQNFVYTFFPYHRDLIYKAENRIIQLGGSKIPFPAGGYTHFIANILGWRLTKILKSLINVIENDCKSRIMLKK